MVKYALCMALPGLLHRVLGPEAIVKLSMGFSRMVPSH